jgi:hypothetical protein
MNILTPSPDRTPFPPFEGAYVQVAGRPGRYKVVAYREGERTATIRAVPKHDRAGHRNDVTAPVADLRWAPTGDAR